MAILTLQLSHPRFTLVEDNGSLIGKIWFDGTLTGDDLSVKDGDGTEYPATAIVTFIAQEAPDATGSLSYSARWHDEAEGVTYPGSCQLSLPAKRELWELLQASSKDDYELHLMVESTSDVRAIYYMGPDDEGEYHWDPNVRNPLPARINSIGLVPAIRQPSELVPKVAEVDQTEVLLDALLEATKSAHVAQASELQAVIVELKRVRSFLLAAAILFVVFVIVKAI